jgi:hypothetical protein
MEASRWIKIAARAINGATCSLFPKTYHFSPCLQAHRPEQHVCPCSDFHKTRAFPVPNSFRIETKMWKWRHDVFMDPAHFDVFTSATYSAQVCSAALRGDLDIEFIHAVTKHTEILTAGFCMPVGAASLSPNTIPPKSRILNSDLFRTVILNLTFILLMWRIGWVPNSVPIYVQQDATLHSLLISGNCSTCFGWYFNPSSGAHTTVSTAYGICHTVIAICRYRGRVGNGLSVLWVA